MNTAENPVEEPHVTCEICLKEVPISEAVVPEATDYFVYFCGVGCFEKWQCQREMPVDPTPKTGV